MSESPHEEGAAAPGPGSPRGADLVREALARAKADAVARSAARSRINRSAARAARAADESRESSEPVAFGSAVREMIDRRGWQAEEAAARVVAQWPSIVGEEIAAATQAVRLRNGELLVEAESTAWATQLRLLSRQLLARIHAELGEEVVTKIVVRGPTAPDWRHGRLRVPGRGPRDTYG